VRRVAQTNPRYGYRRVAVKSGLGFGRTWRLPLALRLPTGQTTGWKQHDFRLGPQLSMTSVPRGDTSMWKQHDFRLAPQRRRPKRQPTTGPNRPCQAKHPKHVWTYDILHDQLADGRPFKTLSVVDEFTRECVAILVAHSIQAADVIAVLRKVFRRRWAPEFLRSDNGSEFTAPAVRTWLADYQVGPTFISPGQPWKNGFIESFHDKLRDECLNREWFQSLVEAQVVIEKWRKHYNM
jgi:transposase InsO family protein